MHTLRLSLVLTCAIMLSPALVTMATAAKCDRCGCNACVHKICRPVKTTKEITEVCWDVECEDFCVPGPSKKCGVKCGRDACGCWSYPLWQPTCAEVRTRRIPIKKEVKRQVPAVEWVVEYVCDHCRRSCASGEAEQKQPTAGIQANAPGQVKPRAADENKVEFTGGGLHSEPRADGAFADY